MNWLFDKLIKSEYVKAHILSYARHIVTTLGATLIAKGYADQGMVEGTAGLVTLAIGFYLSHKDVNQVDKKIEQALNTPAPVVYVRPAEISSTPSPSGMTEEQEKELTRLLNISQQKGATK